jgi:hypothetical protein
MRHLLTLILFLAAGSARAELNTEGLPAGATAIVGFDWATFRATKLWPPIANIFDLKCKNREIGRKFREQIGIDTNHDLQEFVLAVYTGGEGNVAENNKSCIVLIRGNFLPATIDAFGKNHGLPSRIVGKHQAWEAAPFMNKLLAESQENTKDAYVVAYSEKLVIIAGAELLERALDAADRVEKSPLLPAAVVSKFAAAQKGCFYLYANEAKMQKIKQAFGIDGIEDVSLVIDENTNDLQFAAAARFVEPEKVDTKLEQIKKGRQNFLTMLRSSPNDLDDELKHSLTMMSELLQNIRFGGEGSQVTVELNYPADNMANAIEKGWVFIWAGIWRH